MKKACSLLLLFLCCLTACRQAPNTITPAFYYWKTTWQESAPTEAARRQVAPTKLYTRIADVGWNSTTQMPQPHDQLRNPAALPAGGEIIPVLFVELPVLRALKTAAQTEKLAADMARLFQSYEKTGGWKTGEYQVDCDWTESISEPYFELLKALKAQPQLAGKTLSVTIRLYQIKYRGKTGMPPADRGLLMCYNTGNFRNPFAPNSILHLPEVEDYLGQLESYPLPLDLGLPLFRWTLWFKQNKFAGILRGLDPDSLAQYPFLKREGALYRCASDTLLRGYPLQKGDLLKGESPTPAEVAKTANWVSRRMPHKKFSVAFYHLDSLLLQKFTPHELETIVQSCR
jgi:hypothetical protein